MTIKLRRVMSWPSVHCWSLTFNGVRSRGAITVTQRRQEAKAGLLLFIFQRAAIIKWYFLIVFFLISRAAFTPCILWLRQHDLVTLGCLKGQSAVFQPWSDTIINCDLMEWIAVSFTVEIIYYSKLLLIRLWLWFKWRDMYSKITRPSVCEEQRLSVFMIVTGMLHWITLSMKLRVVRMGNERAEPFR